MCLGIDRSQQPLALLKLRLLSTVLCCQYWRLHMVLAAKSFVSALCLGRSHIVGRREAYLGWAALEVSSVSSLSISMVATVLLR